MNSSFCMWSSSAQSGSQKPLDIGDQDRLLVPAELRPGELLDQLLQRADAARQRHEGVGVLEHDALSLVHVAGDDPLLHARQHVLAVDQEVRNYAGHHAAMVEDRIRQRAHQADRPAAIDQPDAVLGQDSSEPRAASTKAGLLPGPEAQ